MCTRHALCQVPQSTQEIDDTHYKQTKNVIVALVRVSSLKNVLQSKAFEKSSNDTYSR